MQMSYEWLGKTTERETEKMIEIADVKEPTLESYYKEYGLNGIIYEINDGKISKIIR